MGQAVAQAIASHEHFSLACMWVRNEQGCGDLPIAHDRISGDIDQVASSANVLVDFSLPEASAQILNAAISHNKPIVCGVSGYAVEQMEMLDKAAAQIPIVYDRNMSIGVAVLDELVRLAAASLGASFAAEIHEVHHIHKQDAPSGTALKLGEAVAQARGQNFQDVAWYAPDAGAREIADGDIRFEVERRGEVPGDHTVSFQSATEGLTLKHSVSTRDVFADGALRAARWIADKNAGRYSMQDVLFGN
jgi:4-hydroxy-tetrahydrodipicolinate reductase